MSQLATAIAPIGKVAPISKNGNRIKSDYQMIANQRELSNENEF